MKLVKQTLTYLFLFIKESLTPVIKLTARFSLIALGFYVPFKMYTAIPHQHHKAIANNIHNTDYILSNSPFKYNAVIKLHLFLEEGEGYCSGFVVDATHAFTAAHCTPGLITGKTFATDSEEKSHIPITDYNSNKRGDYAVLIGDFSKFNALLVVVNTPTVVDLYAQPIGMCGYPMGQKQMVCTEGVDAGPTDSMMLAKGELYPGMSGGPVVVDLPIGLVAVAVNSATDGPDLILAPLIGITAL